MDTNFKCKDCTNTENSVACYQLSWCQGCSKSSGCKWCYMVNQSVDCEHCQKCDNCTRCVSCIGCINCTDCLNCFNCEGLQNKTGWVNNQPPKYQHPSQETKTPQISQKEAQQPSPQSKLPPPPQETKAPQISPAVNEQKKTDVKKEEEKCSCEFCKMNQGVELLDFKVTDISGKPVPDEQQKYIQEFIKSLFQ